MVRGKGEINCGNERLKAMLALGASLAPDQCPKDAKLIQQGQDIFVVDEILKGFPPQLKAKLVWMSTHNGTVN